MSVGLFGAVGFTRRPGKRVPNIAKRAPLQTKRWCCSELSILKKSLMDMVVENHFIPWWPGETIETAVHT